MSLATALAESPGVAAAAIALGAIALTNCASDDSVEVLSPAQSEQEADAAPSAPPASDVDVDEVSTDVAPADVLADSAPIPGFCLMGPADFVLANEPELPFVGGDLGLLGEPFIREIRDDSPYTRGVFQNVSLEDVSFVAGTATNDAIEFLAILAIEEDDAWFTTGLATLLTEANIGSQAVLRYAFPEGWTDTGLPLLRGIAVETTTGASFAPCGSQLDEPFNAAASAAGAASTLDFVRQWVLARGGDVEPFEQAVSDGQAADYEIHGAPVQTVGRRTK